MTHLVINKIDILDKLKVWKILKGNKIIIFKNSTAMRKFIIKEIKITGIKNKNIFFSAVQIRFKYYSITIDFLSS